MKKDLINHIISLSDDRLSYSELKRLNLDSLKSMERMLLDTRINNDNPESGKGRNPFIYEWRFFPQDNVVQILSYTGKGKDPDTGEYRKGLSLKTKILYRHLHQCAESFGADIGFLDNYVVDGEVTDDGEPKKQFNCFKVLGKKVTAANFLWRFMSEYGGFEVDKVEYERKLNEIRAKMAAGKKVVVRKKAVGR